MIKRERDLQELIEYNLSQKIPFACFRLPESDSFSFVAQVDDAKVLKLNKIEQITHQSGFVVAPFATSESTPICIIRPDVTQCFDVSNFAATPLVTTPLVVKETGEAAYQKRFKLFMEQLQGGKLKKVVLSRSIEVDHTSVLNLLAYFITACRTYSDAYIYLCYTEESGIWLGSTPEILVDANGEQWTTVALAGTQSLTRGGKSVRWDDKNLQEQAIVASYINNHLRDLKIEAEIHGPFTVSAGKLVHLKTEFNFQLSWNANLLGALLERLHPTPAVCGLPKEKAYRFILDHEANKRAYYSGFVGFIDQQNHSASLYVNLRCMHLQTNSAVLYAGGGLLASSKLSAEWQETEKKLQTMKRIINFE